MTRNDDVDVEGEGDVMLYALAKLVSIPTVSDDVHRERSVPLPVGKKTTDQQLSTRSTLITQDPISTWSSGRIGMSAEVTRRMKC